MRFLDRFFRRSPPPPPPGPRRNVEELTRGLAEPACLLGVSDRPTRSHFGGDPALPTGVAWPERHGERLVFLARLSLAEVQQCQTLPWLPGEGALLFFYVEDQSVWGFDPADRGAWAVLHVADLPGPAQPAPGPVAFRPIAFTAHGSRPGSEREAVRFLGLSEAEDEAYQALLDAPFGERPRHQVGGFPAPVQGDEMELECQLVSYGLYCGDSTGYKDPRARDLRPGAAEWRLLFQMDSDDALGVMWGDVGLLYYFVREPAARAGRFEDAWLILQCC